MATDTKNYKEFQKLSYKDIENLLITISERTAKQYLNDIKQHYQIDIVTYQHFKNYFKVQ
jgi:hypothetical protein